MTFSQLWLSASISCPHHQFQRSLLREEMKFVRPKDTARQFVSAVKPTFAQAMAGLQVVLNARVQQLCVSEQGNSISSEANGFEIVTYDSQSSGSRRPW